MRALLFSSNDDIVQAVHTAFSQAAIELEVARSTQMFFASLKSFDRPDFVVLEFVQPHPHHIAICVDLVRMATVPLVLITPDEALARECVSTAHTTVTWLNATFADYLNFVNRLQLMKSQLKEDHPRARLDRLSSRQEETLRLIVKGMSEREIAGTLGVSIGTVKSHLFRVREKLGCQTNADLRTLVRKLTDS